VADLDRLAAEAEAAIARTEADLRRQAQSNGAGRESDRYAGRILDIGEMLAQPDEPIPWRCRDLAADGYLTVLAGRGGEGKSWLALALACGVARGEAAAGIPCARGRAVIFDAENGPKLTIRRFRAAAVTPSLAVQPVDAGGLRVTTDLPWFRKVVEDQGANLVVFDSLRVLSSGSKESDGDEMEPIVTALKLFARETGAAVILVHHRGKNEASDYRGSSVILDQTDLLFTLGRVSGDPEGRRRRKITTIKCRIEEEPEPRWVRIEVDREHGRVYVNATDAYEEDGGRPRDEWRDKVLGQLTGIQQPAARIATALGRGKTDGTIRRVLEDLERDGLVVRGPGGWGVATTIPLGVGNPGNPPENRSTEPNQGLPPAEHAGNPSGDDSQAEFERLRLKFGEADELDEDDR
jgi:AAA domain